MAEMNQETPSQKETSQAKLDDIVCRLQQAESSIRTGQFVYAYRDLWRILKDVHRDTSFVDSLSEAEKWKLRDACVAMKRAVGFLQNIIGSHAETQSALDLAKSLSGNHGKTHAGS